jgi:enterochelin esterase-like enzyme
MQTRSILSPRIRSLQQVVEAGNMTALEDFWQEVAEHGAPLIESIEHDERHKLVTFLWREQGETHNVVLVGGPASWDYAKNQLSRLLHTDLWYKTYRLRSDLRATYQLSPNDPLIPLDDTATWAKHVMTLQVDPFNPRTFELPGTPYRSSIIELPDAPKQPYAALRPNTARGRLLEHHIDSAILGGTRRVWIYTPPGYVPDGEQCGLFLLFDGPAYIQMIPAPATLDNLLSEGKIPPLVAVFIENSPQTRNQELCCSLSFVEFVTQELLPWVHQHHAVTCDPAQTIAGGVSLGGLAAAFAAFKAPHIIGNVLSQSGSFWWGPGWRGMESSGETFEDEGDAEWLTRQFVVAPRLPLQFYLDVGLLERSFNPVQDQRIANRHFRDVLQAKGYQVSYAEFNGGHDFLSWRGTLADGLLALIGKKQ